MEKHIVDRTFEKKYNATIYWLDKPPQHKKKQKIVVGTDKNGFRKELLI
ncbi:MAG: hypothetical protein ACOXZ0_07055 [Eubacteriales bacterium]|jgi:hypothetical protein